MLRVISIAMIGASLIAGCEAQHPSQVDPDARASIGYAATAKYPGNPLQRPDKVQAAAVDYPKLRELEILNLSQNAIPAATIWVNGMYMRRVGTIPPQGSTTVRYANLLQAGQPANDFTMLKQPVTKVEIETADGLFTVAGPSVKR